MVKQACVLFLVLAAACGSEKTDAFVRVAKQAQPEFLALRESADVVLDTLGTDDNTNRLIVEACLKPSFHLKNLSEIDFDSRLLRPPTTYSVADTARGMLEGQQFYCRRNDAGSVEDLERCSRWCAVAWTGLALAVERFRGDALAQGVGVRTLTFE